MKKTAAILMAAGMAAISLTGCLGSSAKPEKPRLPRQQRRLKRRMQKRKHPGENPRRRQNQLKMR